MVNQPPLTREMLAQMRDGPSAYGKSQREGIYIKVSDGGVITHRYKMVTPGFHQNEDWNKTEITRNRVLKK